MKSAIKQLTKTERNNVFKGHLNYGQKQSSAII